MANLNARLSCRHVTTISSTSYAIGAYCRFHGWQDIAEVYEQEWRVVCLTCQYGAWCNQAEKGAQRRAAKHRADRGHEVTVLYDNKRKPKARSELRATETPVELFLFDGLTNDDPPPF